MKNKKIRNIILIIAAVVLVIFGVLVSFGGLFAITITYVNHYTDTNTWATIVTDHGLEASEDGFRFEEEFKKFKQ